jgi:phosphoribosyl 1,2-cyclic phosphodiesterase
MPITVHSLASGSSGNSILITDGKTTILIDAGIGIRKLTAALLGAGINPADVSAMFITHEHGDHVRGAVRTARRHDISIIANARTLERIEDARNVPHMVLDVDEEMSIGDLLVRPFPISHDAACPVGYSVHAKEATVTYATDTGVLTPRIRDEAMLSDLLIVESNHDIDMLRTGPYPRHLKRRIEGEKGHISNDVAAGLILDLADREKPTSVWLAHLSQTNNSPAIALSTAQYLLWTCFGTTIDLQVASRDVPSLWWKSR